MLFSVGMGSTVRSVSTVAGATMVSRLLGFARDILMFAGLGAGPYLSAFVLAFTLPNLLRRLLGEGALTSAVVPVLAHNLERSGRQKAFEVLNRVLSRLGLFLLGAAVLGGGTLILVSFWPGLPFRWMLAGQLSALLLPYGLFICAAAMFAAQLNVLRRFLVPALSPIWLNLAMITALGLGLWRFSHAPLVQVLLLCAAVLIGGLAQALIPGLALRREGWRPALDVRRDTAMDEIWVLLLPGLAGAAILQVNLLLSRFLAFSIDDAAVSILYLANRLVELPYGVFAVAVTTVAFPQMARAVGRKDSAGFREAYEGGRGAIWLITLPAAVGLIVLADPILTLFAVGNFAAADAARTVVPLQVMAFALPFFSWTMLATRGLHSWKEMRQPMRFGAVNAALNLGLGVVLMIPLREVGLALANVIAAIVLTILMERALAQRNVTRMTRRHWLSLMRLGLACAAMAGALWGWFAVVRAFVEEGKLEAFALVGGGIPLGALTYFGVCFLLRAPELKLLQDRLRRRLAAAPQSP